MNPRTILASALTTVVLALVAAAVVIGHSDATPSVHLSAGSAWFATPREGSLALLDGGTGSRVAKVENVAPAGANLALEQSGTSALVVDRDRGTVTKVDGATWTASPPLQVASGRDDALAVLAAGGTAWVVTQGGSVVQQLDPERLALIGSPQTLLAAVSDVAISPDGRLWAVAGSGQLRSFANGQQATEADVTSGGHLSLAMVGNRPVVVDMQSSQATLIDPERGTADHRVCLDLPTTTAPVVGGASDGAPWLLGVSPTNGTLVVSDVDNSTCRVVALGATAADPRYGTPVAKGGLVFVPDFVASQVIVVDPGAQGDQQVRARVDLGLGTSEVALRVQDQHVWFNEVKGDRAGVITDDLKAHVVSKVDAGSSESQTPRSPPSPQPGPGGGGGGNSGPGAGQAGAAGAPTAGPNDATKSRAGLDAPAPLADPGALPPDAGAGGGAGGGGGSSDPSGNVTVDFTPSSNPAVAGQPVTFTDVSSGTHTVTQWSAPGAIPQASTNGTFTTTFNAAGTFNVTLTVNTPSGAQSVIHPITVDTQLTVPDLHGLTKDLATAALGKVGLLLGNKTGTTETALGPDQIVDTNPPKGAPAKPGDTVTYRLSTPTPFADFALPPGETKWNGMVGGPDGNIWLTLFNNNKILRVSPEGTLTTFSIPTPNSGPYGIAVGPDGNIWFTEQTASKVGRVNLQATPITVDDFPTPLPNSGPTGIAAGSEGSLWVSLTNQNAVAQVQANGRMTVHPLFQGPAPDWRPNAIVLGADENIYVSETAVPMIYRIAPNGTITPFALPAEPGYAGAVKLAAGPDGTIGYLRQTGGQGKVGMLLPSGATIQYITTYFPNAIAYGADGKLWVSEFNTDGSGTDDIATFTEDFDVNGTKIKTPSTAADPTLVTNGPGKMLWFIESGLGKIARVTLP